MPHRRSPRQRLPDKTDAALRRFVSLALEMEEPLRDADRFLRALRLVGYGLSQDDEDEGGAILALAFEAGKRVEQVRVAWETMTNTRKQRLKL